MMPTEPNLLGVLVAALAIHGCGSPSPARETGVSSDGQHAPASTTNIASARQAPSAAHAASLPAAAHPFRPDDDPACRELATLTAEVRLWQVAANPQPHKRKVAAAWPTLPATCRGGTFYLVAAELVGHATDASLATTDGAVVIHSSSDALSRGLSAEPDHPRLLAHLAFAADVAPDAKPELSSEACQHARDRGGDAWTDDAAYVCALAAIHAGDGNRGLAELDRIHSTVTFPDLLVRRVQALRLAGKSGDAAALTQPALDALAKAPPRFDLTAAAIDALKKKLHAR